MTDSASLQAEIERLRTTSAAANQILREMQACGTWDDATMRRVIENIGPLLSVKETTDDR